MAARQKYLKAAQTAHASGKVHLYTVRGQIETLRTQAHRLGSDRLAAAEIARAEELFLAAKDDNAAYAEVETALNAALAHYREVLRVTAERKRIEEEKASRGIITAAGIEFIWIPPGVFEMGSVQGPKEEMPRHTVKIDNGFWIAKFPVTQEQWRAVMGANPSGDRKSVV